MNITEITNIPLPEDSPNYACSNQQLPVHYQTDYSDIPNNPRGLPKSKSEPSTSQPPLPAFAPPSNPPPPSVSDVSDIINGKYIENIINQICMSLYILGVYVSTKFH